MTVLCKGIFIVFSEITQGKRESDEYFSPLCFPSQPLDMVCILKQLHHLTDIFTRCSSGCMHKKFLTTHTGLAHNAMSPLKLSLEKSFSVKKMVTWSRGHATQIN